MSLKIAISGKITSGKTTTALYIKNKSSEIVVVNFAGRMKELATELFGFDPTKKDRKLLQDFGSVVREIDENAWVNSLHERTKGMEKVVIDDLRLPNEYIYVKKQGYITIRLEVSKKTQEKRIKRLYKNYTKHLERIDHYTETALDDYEFDYIIDANDETKINEQIDSILFKVHYT